MAEQNSIFGLNFNPALQDNEEDFKKALLGQVAPSVMAQVPGIENVTLGQAPAVSREGIQYQTPEESQVSPEALAGLGLGGGVVASQMGGPLTVRPNVAPPAMTGQIVPSYGGGMKPANVTGVYNVVRPALTGPTQAGTFNPQSLNSKVVGGIFKGGIVGGLMTPNTMGDATLTGNGIRADGSSWEDFWTKKYQEEQSGLAANSQGPQMSKLGDEPINFGRPTGPSATPESMAQLPQTTPVDAGLMGSPQVAAPAVPTYTLNTIDGGQVIVPQGFADQTFRGEDEGGRPKLRSVTDLILLSSISRTKCR